MPVVFSHGVMLYTTLPLFNEPATCEILSQSDNSMVGAGNLAKSVPCGKRMVTVLLAVSTTPTESPTAYRSMAGSVMRLFSTKSR